MRWPAALAVAPTVALPLAVAPALIGESTPRVALAANSTDASTVNSVSVERTSEASAA